MADDEKTSDEQEERVTAESESVITFGSRSGQRPSPDHGLVTAESEPMFTWTIDCSKTPAS